MTLAEFNGHLLVGMGPPAAGTGHRAGLGAWLRGVPGVPRHAARYLDGARGPFWGGLGGLQGAIGWCDGVLGGWAPGMLDVASYRLAVHLGLAFLILCADRVVRSLQLGPRGGGADGAARREGDRKLKGMATGVLHLSVLQILIGALVAGIDAGRKLSRLAADGGRLHTAWACGRWSHGGATSLENDGTVQFIHRMVGYVLLLVAAAAVALPGRRSARTVTRGAFHAMMLMMVLQVALGIVTVLYSAPWYFAILHQFGGGRPDRADPARAVLRDVPDAPERAGGPRHERAERSSGLPAPDRGAGPGDGAAGLGPGDGDAPRRGCAAGRGDGRARGRAACAAGPIRGSRSFWRWRNPGRRPRRRSFG